MPTCQTPLDYDDFFSRTSSTDFGDLSEYTINVSDFNNHLSSRSVDSIWASASTGVCSDTVSSPNTLTVPDSNTIHAASRPGLECTSDSAATQPIANTVFYLDNTGIGLDATVDVSPETGITCRVNHGTEDDTTLPQISCVSPDGTGSDHRSSYTLTGCVQCLAGFENTNGEGGCDLCPNNEISAGGTDCAQCPQGSVSAQSDFISNGGSLITTGDTMPTEPSAATAVTPHITCTGKVCNSSIPPGYRLVDSGGTEFDGTRPFLEYVVNGGSPAETYTQQPVSSNFALENGYSGTCTPGYRRVGDVRITPCDEWGGDLQFEGCEPISGSQNYEDEDESVFDSDFDGSLDVEFKHIAGGVFIVFLGISIMGIIKKKTKQ